MMMKRVRKKKLPTFCKLEERYQNLGDGRPTVVQEVGGSTLLQLLLGFFSKVSKNREKRLISDDTRASSSVAQGVGGFTVNQDVEGSTLTRNQSFLQVQQPRSKPPTARRRGSSVAASG